MNVCNPVACAGRLVRCMLNTHPCSVGLRCVSLVDTASCCVAGMLRLCAMLWLATSVLKCRISSGCCLGLMPRLNAWACYSAVNMKHCCHAVKILKKICDGSTYGAPHTPIHARACSAHASRPKRKALPYWLSAALAHTVVHGHISCICLSCLEPHPACFPAPLAYPSSPSCPMQPLPASCRRIGKHLLARPGRPRLQSDCPTARHCRLNAKHLLWVARAG